jgi:hypothetical protein
MYYVSVLTIFTFIGCILTFSLLTGLMLEPRASPHYSSNHEQCLIVSENTTTKWCSEYNSECVETVSNFPVCGAILSSPPVNGSCIADECCLSEVCTRYSTSCMNKRCSTSCVERQCELYGSDIYDYVFKECWDFALTLQVDNRLYNYTSSCGFGDYECYSDFTLQNSLNKTVDCWIKNDTVYLSRPNDAPAWLYFLVVFFGVGIIACGIFIYVRRNDWNAKFCGISEKDVNIQKQQEYRLKNPYVVSEVVH